MAVRRRHGRRHGLSFSWHDSYGTPVRVEKFCLKKGKLIMATFRRLKRRFYVVLSSYASLRCDTLFVMFIATRRRSKVKCSHQKAYALLIRSLSQFDAFPSVAENGNKGLLFHRCYCPHTGPAFQTGAVVFSTRVSLRWRRAKLSVNLLPSDQITPRVFITVL